jgi:putative phosphoesterase
VRILLVADIHSNRPALEALRERFDIALCLGDIVEYGVEPGPCVEWVRAHCLHSIRGNHDHGAAHDVPSIPNGTKGFKYLTASTRQLGRQRMNEDQRRFLAGLPLTRFITLDGIRMMLVHATPRDPLDEYAPGDAEVWAKRLEGIDVDVVCVGHTHRQFALQINNTTVINAGSVGLQRDGDPRAAYAVIDGTKIELKRFEYPIEETVRGVEGAPLPDDVKQMLTHVYREGCLRDSKLE